MFDTPRHLCTLCLQNPPSRVSSRPTAYRNTAARVPEGAGTGTNRSRSGVFCVRERVVPMPIEIPKQYEPSTIEPRVYERWLAAKAFAAVPDARQQRYVIMMPLPNVTGA